MKYLLDTCVISDFVKGEHNTQKRIKEVQPNHLAVSVITLMEIYYGLIHNPERAKKIKPIIENFLHRINILGFSKAEAEEAALLRSKLHRQGTPIGSYDILISATALTNQLILITANEKEFSRIQPLRLENWRLS